MAFIPVPNVAQANVMHRLHDQDVENTFYWYKSTGWSEVELIDLASAIISAWTQEIMPLLGVDLSFEKVRVRDLTQATGQALELPVLPVVNGGIGSPGLPGNVALVAKRATGYSGRNARGRIYFGGLTESQVTANEVGSSLATLLSAGLSDFCTIVEGLVVDSIAVHVSRYLNGLPRIVGAWWAIVSWIVNVDTDSQRRRLKGRGSDSLAGAATDLTTSRVAERFKLSMKQ